MKLTLSLRNFFDRQCKHYCNQIGLKEEPLIIYEDHELEEIGLTFKQIRTIEKQELGRSWASGNFPEMNRDVIYINVENSDFLWQLIDTVVHELVHIRFPNEEHGKEFQDKVNRIILGERF